MMHISIKKTRNHNENELEIVRGDKFKQMIDLEYLEMLSLNIVCFLLSLFKRH